MKRISRVALVQKRIELSFDIPKNRGNARESWAGRHFGFKRYQEAALRMINASGINRKETWFEAKLSLEVVGKRSYDMDNLTSLLKWPLDTLVRAHILYDDSWKHLQFGAVPFQRRPKKGENPRMILTFDVLKICTLSAQDIMNREIRFNPSKYRGFKKTNITIGGGSTCRM